MKYLEGLTRQQLVYLCHAWGFGSLAASLVGIAWPELTFVSVYGFCSLFLVYLPMVVAMRKFK